MLAEIASGERDWADVLFLIAAIIFALTAVLPHFRRRPTDDTTGVAFNIGVSLVPAGLCLVAIAWMLL